MLQLLTAASETKLHGERQGGGGGGGAMLAQASLQPKATETDLALASSFPARPPASTSLLSLVEGGGGGRRLAPAGRRLATRCVLVHEYGSRSTSRIVCLGADAEFVSQGIFLVRPC
jgi:hypothetical protein